MATMNEYHTPPRSLLVTDLPIVYEIDPSTNMVYAAVGPWTPAAVAEWVEQLLADPLYEPGMRGMLNLRFTAGPLPDAETTWHIVEALRPLTRIPVRTRWAVLVSSAAMFVRVRLIETLTSDGYIHFRGFQDSEDAIKWLGLESARNSWLKRM